MNQYLAKYGFQSSTIIESPDINLGLIVVIPCFNEPDIIGSINSLQTAVKPKTSVEVIVVVNNGNHHSDAIKNQNLKSIADLKNHKIESSPLFKLHIIEALDLPKKHAGVGLARKIGMDEAVARFEINENDGLIVCFDADSTCDSNYFIAIENHFKKHSKSAGAAIKFEHPIEGTDFDESIYEGIINYELFLRYYNQGLKHANLPFAFHTVGSSMVVRSSAYQKQGGMNKRKAGEDFYFLHKIISLGGFTEINTTKVIPSPRTSDRVPFGTGKAISDWIEDETTEYLTYDVRIWEILRDFQSQISTLHTTDLIDLDFSKNPINKQFLDFLDLNEFEKGLKEIRSNSTSLETFTKRFYAWFNAFRVLKLVHYLRDKQFPNQAILNQAKLMAKQRGFFDDETSTKELLKSYRLFESID
ncbi:MAG: glycosyltransferase family 2 protein [Crocinitomicaceae bacterium]